MYVGGATFPADRRRLQKDVASLGLGLPQYPDSLVAITTCNPRESPVTLGSRGWVATGHPRLDGKKALCDYLPDLGVCPQLPPRQGMKSYLEPSPPAFIGDWKPCPAKRGERRASSPCAFHLPWISKHQLVHHPNDADPFMRPLLCQPLGSAISALSLERVTGRPSPCPGVYKAAHGVRSLFLSVPCTPTSRKLYPARLSGQMRSALGRQLNHFGSTTTTPNCICRAGLNWGPLRLNVRRR